MSKPSLSDVQIDSPVHIQKSCSVHSPVKFSGMPRLSARSCYLQLSGFTIIPGWSSMLPWLLIRDRGQLGGTDGGLVLPASFCGAGLAVAFMFDSLCEILCLGEQFP